METRTCALLRSAVAEPDAAQWLTSKTDQELLDTYVEGNNAALCCLMERYQRFLLCHCHRLMGGNSHDAKDLFSLVVLKVFSEQPEHIKRVRHLGGWLSRVALNMHIDLRRERQAEERRNQSLEYLHEISGWHPRSPEEEFLDSELVTHIDRAFKALPIRLRKTAELRFIENASYCVIAGQLGISQVNARKRVQEARQSLANALIGYKRGY